MRVLVWNALHSTWMLLPQDRVLNLCYQWKNTLFLKNIYLKIHKLILKSNSRNPNLARRSVYASKNRLSTWQKLFNTILKSRRSSRSQNVYNVYDEIFTNSTKCTWKFSKHLAAWLCFKTGQALRSRPWWKFCEFRIPRRTIDLVMVFDAILTSRQTREKLQCLYENLMSNNFRITAFLIKKKIVN